MTAAASSIQIVIPHQVLKGINCNENDVVETDIARVTVIIMRKYSQLIEDKPETKHSISSGKSGKRNIIESIR